VQNDKTVGATEIKSLNFKWHWNGFLCADMPLRNYSLTHS